MAGSSPAEGYSCFTAVAKSTKYLEPDSRGLDPAISFVNAVPPEAQMPTDQARGLKAHVSSTVMTNMTAPIYGFLYLLQKELTMSLLMFLAERLKEPSTYAGLGAFLGAAGIHIDDVMLQAIVQLLVSIAGLIAVLVPEKRLSN